MEWRFLSSKIPIERQAEFAVKLAIFTAERNGMRRLCRKGGVCPEQNAQNGNECAGVPAECFSDKIWTITRMDPLVSGWVSCRTSRFLLHCGYSVFLPFIKFD